MKTIEFREGPEDELWSVTQSLPPHIEVSTLGRVRVYKTLQLIEEVVPGVSNGYKYISYGGDTYAVHRLIAETFLPYTGDDDCKRLLVKHLDGDKCNNAIDNLQWTTSANDNSKGIDKKNKIYCKELDTVFGTMRSACYLTSIPQDIIARAMREHTAVCGLTFDRLDSNDPVIANKEIAYIDYDEMYIKACQSKSVEELVAAVRGEKS